MDTIIIIALLAIGIFFAYKYVKPKADLNQDGKLDINDVKMVADANKDGKVDLADAKEAVAKVKKGRKKKAE